MSAPPPPPPPSLWLAGPRPRFDSLIAHRTADVAIVGGGISGVLLAGALRRRGVDCLVLERYAVAWGASGRNAGFLLFPLAEPYAAMAERLGRERARGAVALSAETRQHVIELVADEGIDCRLRTPGSWILARDFPESEGLRASASLLAEDGFAGIEWCEPGTLPAPYRELGLLGGLHAAGDGELDPAALVRGLALRARARGVPIFEGARVRTIAEHATSVTLECEGDVRVSASLAVLATNAYTPQLLADTGAWIQPKRGQLLATSPWSERVVDRPACARHGFEYWRQEPGGRLLVGGWRDTEETREVGYDERPTPSIQAHLERWAASLLGVRPADVPVEHRWAGVMAFTADGLPIVGAHPVRPRVFLVGGYNGHGIGWAAACVERLADMLGGAPAHGDARADRGLTDPARLGQAGAAQGDGARRDDAPAGAGQSAARV